MVYLASALSVHMLPKGSHAINSTFLSREQFQEGVRRVTANVVNPRHRTTCELAGLLTGLPCLGGLTSLRLGDEVYVIVPGRANREGAEVALQSLEECEFWHFHISY